MKTDKKLTENPSKNFELAIPEKSCCQIRPFSDPLSDGFGNGLINNKLNLLKISKTRDNKLRPGS